MLPGNEPSACLFRSGANSRESSVKGVSATMNIRGLKLLRTIMKSSQTEPSGIVCLNKLHSVSKFT